ncbi:LysR family transcriptional regulator [Anaerovibrio lipolyticus]|uniref:LysR family transcriptional regulator n=1 Tax=Anaerovibrio lipolyticus TaxID=82374 RepID=UPI000907452B
MELRVLKYFLTVAQEESFSRAAEKLHLFYIQILLWLVLNQPSAKPSKLARKRPSSGFFFCLSNTSNCPS